MLDLLLYPNLGLRLVCKPVEDFNFELSDLVDDMFRAMDWHNGVGLAAPQVNVFKRIIVVGLDKINRHAIINPVLVLTSGEQTGIEGCLSIPGIGAPVRRAMAVEVAGLDVEGNDIKLIANGLLARALQHEIDHLNGRLFIDYLSDPERKTLMARYKKETHAGRS